MLRAGFRKACLAEDAKHEVGAPMRILYVSQYFPPEPGAPAARVSELARAWAQRGHEVTVLTGMPHHPTGLVPPEYRGKLLVKEYEGGASVVRTWIFATANRGRARRSLSYASFAASACLLGQWRVTPPDVVIGTSPQFLCAVAGHLIARLRRVPFVFEVRDLWPESIVAVGALPASHPVIYGLEVLEQHLYRQADRIVVVADSFRARLVDRGVPSSKLQVIRNGADLKRFHPLPRDTALRNELEYGDRFVIAYVGTHGMAHGLDLVLDVAALLRERDDMRFLFVGEGAERRALEARAHAQRMTNVRFLGVLSRDRMNEVYATADLCLVPLRRTELFRGVIPSKIFEIMAMQRPILISVDGEARSIVEAAGAGLFSPPGDAEAMRGAIEALCADRARCRQMGLAGRNYVIREFDRSRLADSYLDVLRDVVARGGPG
jgi:glycosyltransferase involved in cell wall biosynthesis